jgi:hypothetical protein
MAYDFDQNFGSETLRAKTFLASRTIPIVAAYSKLIHLCLCSSKFLIHLPHLLQYIHNHSMMRQSMTSLQAILFVLSNPDGFLDKPPQPKSKSHKCCSDTP